MPVSWNSRSLRAHTRFTSLLLVVATVAAHAEVTALLTQRFTAASSVAVQAAVLREEQSTDGGFSARRALPEEVYRSGDRFQLEALSPLDGYLYVLMKGSEGDTKLLFPYDGLPKESNRVRRGQRKVFPVDSIYVLDDKPGVEELYFVVAARPIPNLERAASKGAGDLGGQSLPQYVGDEREPEWNGSKGIGRVFRGGTRPTRPETRRPTYAVGELRMIHLP